MIIEITKETVQTKAKASFSFGLSVSFVISNSVMMNAADYTTNQYLIYCISYSKTKPQSFVLTKYEPIRSILAMLSSIHMENLGLAPLTLAIYALSSHE